MKDETRSSYHQRILKVLLYIQKHLDRTISLEELAAVACFSPFHFHRVFRGMVGETLAEHVRRLRLERAAQRLALTGDSVTELAFDAGYETVESFTRAFRKRFGQSPTEYRKEKRHGRQMTPKLKSGLESFQMNLKYGGPLNMDVKLVKMKPRKVAFVRHIGPYDQCKTAWETLCAWAGPRGLLGPQTEFLGLCHDDPEVTETSKIRYDACIAASGDMTPAGEVGIQEVAGGEFAVALHVGPYENLKHTYAELCGRWLPASNREVKNAPSVEVYLNDPERTPPDELRVEIQLPLEPRR